MQRMKTFLKSVLLIIFSFLQLSVIGQKRMKKMQASSLFSDTALFEVSLEMDVQSVISDLDERNNHPVKLSYLNESGEEVVIPLQVKVRGKNRANPRICEFPPLRLNFKKSKNDNNLFAGQDKLKLVSHCKDSKSYKQYVLQEYLTYKHYNLLTDFSFRVRLLKVNYKDTNSDQSFTRYGFLIEDLESLAFRNGMQEGGEVLNQDRCDKSVLDIMTVFQYMIGNTDWSITESHNTKLISRDSTGQVPIPIPYDFDYAGAIHAHYAKPPADLPIESVRQRLFRGYCRLPGTYEKVFELMNEKKNDIYALYKTAYRLEPSKRKHMVKYLDSFYEIINNPKKSAREITKACPVPHRHVY